ncbi:MAG: DUF1320 domain-containing protein [Pseudomonadota bacterium]
MSYATQADMVNRFGDREVIMLTDRARAGVIDAAVLAYALDQADAEIDPYLAGHYQLPLPTVPRLLVGFACDIARYRLSAGATNDTEEVRNRYLEAVKFLQKIASREVSLGMDVQNKPVAQGVTVKMSTASSRVFSRTART